MNAAEQNLEWERDRVMRLRFALAESLAIHKIFIRALGTDETTAKTIARLETLLEETAT